MQYRIAVDFDGTICEHVFPEIGSPVPGALLWLRRWQKCGAALFLWTVRSGEPLAAAVEYCRKEGVIFDAVNQVPDDAAWTASPKLYAHIYIDDAAFGCPLVYPLRLQRPYVDWKVVGHQVEHFIEQHRA